MGQCCSTKVGDPLDEAIDAQLNAMAVDARNVVKVLLLGTGESGKSTVFKQMIKLHGGGFSQQELDAEVISARRNALESMMTLCKEAANFTSNGEEGFAVAPDLAEDAEYIVDFDKRIEEGLVASSGAYIARLWPDAGIQATFLRKNEFQIVDSAAYFIEKAEELFSDDYKMSDDDLLRVRVMTTGMKEQKFAMGEGQNMQMLMVDVGGQRSERKKWIKWFYDVYAVIFVTAISEYNQKLFEDNETNRLDESLRVWSEITALPAFEETMFILFLNKMDLFLEKLSDFPLSEFVEDYSGDNNDEDQCKEFMMLKYADLAAIEDIVVHFTTATDTTLMSNVLDAVRSAILKSKLREVGVF